MGTLEAKEQTRRGAGGTTNEQPGCVENNLGGMACAFPDPRRLQWIKTTERSKGERQMAWAVMMSKTYLVRVLGVLSSFCTAVQQQSR